MIIMGYQIYNQVVIKQRMFNSYLKSNTKNIIIKDDRYHSLPVHSSIKGSRRQQTSYKMSNTTNVTKNVTLSAYSCVSKKKPTIVFDIPFNSRKYGFQAKEKGERKYHSTKHRQNKQLKRKGRRGKKEYKKEIKQCETMSTTKFITNRDFYRGSRGSLDSRTTFQFMSKISKIFDLVTLQVKLPIQVQTFLSRPLAVLREKLKKNGKRDISAKLIEFKNGCMQIYKRAGGGQVSLFVRLELPESNRWQARNNDSYIRKESERDLRGKYFEGLRRKQYQQTMEEANRINRIQDRLDAFLQGTFKHRKVYI